MRPFLIVFALLGLGCASAPPSEPVRPSSTHAATPQTVASSRPNILLVTLDTVRADHTSLHGYARDTTPFLTELAGRGVRFDRAYATASWTVPSVASLMTSLEPSGHGVVYGFFKNGRIVDQQVLSDQHTLLAEVLRDAGYRTAAVTSNGHLTAEFGFAQGFDRYMNLGFVNASLLRNQVESFSQFLEEAEPWFLWVHLFDPHAPYEERAMTESYLAGETDFDPQLYADLQHIFKRADLFDRGIRPGDRAHRYVTALYDGEIRYADDQIRAIVDQLGVGDDDMIVVTSDHGEEFFDHDDCWHGHSLYEETIRVPLVLRLPAAARAGTVVDHPVTLLDVMPTILDVAGAGADLPSAAHGQGLFAPARPVRSSVAKVRVLETLIDRQFKYIHGVETGEHALYDMLADPGETRNLLATHAGLAESMQRRLAEWILERPDYVAESSPLREEHIAVLRSLGYVN